MQVGRDVITEQQILRASHRNSKQTITRWINEKRFPAGTIYVYQYAGKKKRKKIWHKSLMKLVKLLDATVPNPRNGRPIS